MSSHDRSTSEDAMALQGTDCEQCGVTRTGPQITEVRVGEDVELACSHCANVYSHGGAVEIDRDIITGLAEMVDIDPPRMIELCAGRTRSSQWITPNWWEQAVIAEARRRQEFRDIESLE